jgi:RNA polymerase sigma-70 factor (ECF subfamily)
MTQEVFVKIWKALPRYRGEASLGTWVFAIARNTCLSRRRREASRRAASLEVAEVRAVAESLHAYEDRHSQELDMRDLLARVPEKYRRVLTLFYLEDRSYEQVAELLGLPLGTVKTHLRRGKKELGALLAARRKEGGTECPAVRSMI